jgi:hypothetical protein
MSQENLAVVLASVEAFNAGDVDAQMATYLPEAVAVTHGEQETRLPDVGSRIEGRAAIGRWVAETLQAWRFRFDVSEIRAVGQDTVLCRGYIGGTGATTGIEGHVETSVLFRVRDGLIERVDFFDDPVEALKAVGLEE